MKLIKVALRLTQGSQSRSKARLASACKGFLTIEQVSFNSKVDEGLRIAQLSGGQKSLVALATVFAIQKSVRFRS